MPKIKYDDNVIVKLRRKYEKDETITFILNKLQEEKDRNELLKKENNNIRIKLKNFETKSDLKARTTKFDKR